MSSPVKDALEGYVAGRVKAERLVIAVSAAYYRDARNGQRESLQPLIDVIDRASPGIVELGTATSGPGFDIRLAERPFPKQYEAQLREAAATVLSGGGVFGGAPLPNAKPSSGMIARLVRAIGRLFTPSA
ncbi:MAG: hypothetical protein DMD42_09020 [Gemmatimonadetes bacterium]|nr:MAG: hypothetical protein DMD42_09020 [Gemmatimonadota bacterium]